MMNRRNAMAGAAVIAKKNNKMTRAHEAAGAGRNGDEPRVPRPVSKNILPKSMKTMGGKKVLACRTNGATETVPPIASLRPVAIVHPQETDPAPQVIQVVDLEMIEEKEGGSADGPYFDVDLADLGKPQLCGEYVKEIYQYLLSLEKQPCFVINQHFLKHQTGSMEHYRQILIDWLVGVSSHFHLLQETLFLAIEILDRYLQKALVTKKQLQLVGVTSLWVAAKYEEIYPPSVAEFAHMTDNTFQKRDVREMEKLILKATDYRLGKPISLRFLRRYSKVGDADVREHNLAKYILECGLHVAATSCIDPSRRAAAALYLSRSLLKTSKKVWPVVMVTYSTYSEASLCEAVVQAKAAVCTVHRHPVLKYTKVKYEKERYLKVSRLSLLENL